MEVLQVERSALGVQPHDTAVESSHSAVSWPAIFCGAAVAAATSLILLALGSGVGMASVSPWSDSGVSPTTFTVAAAIWLIVTQWVASAAGGYLTGRLRTKWVDTHTHEVFFRDTAHGFVTWALATLIAASVAASAATSLVGGGARTAAAVASTEGATTNAARGNGSVGSYDVDVLFRGLSERSSTAADARPEAARIVAKGLVNGDIPAADRSYLAALVSARTGISQAEAAQRVETFITNAKAAADRARKAAMAASLFTALSMLIGAFIACAAAALGGHERDARVATTIR
jgi:hypothetical protein